MRRATVATAVAHAASITWPTRAMRRTDATDDRLFGPDRGRPPRTREGLAWVRSNTSLRRRGDGGSQRHIDDDARPRSIHGLDRLAHVLGAVARDEPGRNGGGASRV